MITGQNVLCDLKAISIQSSLTFLVTWINEKQKAYNAAMYIYKYIKQLDCELEISIA